MAYWGMVLRTAKPGDEMDVARVHVRSWQAAYRKLLPDEYLDGLRPEDRAARYTFADLDPLAPQTTVAVVEGGIAGFVTTAQSRLEALPDFGELCALYVDPDHWGTGIGVALVASARDRLYRLGYRNAFLWVMAGNERAARFYERDGWTQDGTRQTISMWDVTVAEVRYQRIVEAAAMGNQRGVRTGE